MKSNKREIVIKRENYFQVSGWMLTDLNLKGNELLVYAIIYGFSQKEGQFYNGSLQYLAAWTGASKRTIINTLTSLVDKGFLNKQEQYINGVKVCFYNAIYECKNCTTGAEIAPGGGEKISSGGAKIAKVGEKTAPNNIVNNINNNNINNIESKSVSRFTPPTLKEVESYCQERNNDVNAERFIDYYTSNGWMVGKNKMKDWKAAVRNWERTNNQTAPAQAQSKPSMNPQDQRDLERQEEINRMMSAANLAITFPLTNEEYKQLKDYVSKQPEDKFLEFLEANKVFNSLNDLLNGFNQFYDDYIKQLLDPTKLI